MCICVSLCTCEHKSPQSPEEGVRLPGARVTSGCDPPGVSAKNPLRSFARVVHALKLWDISAALLRNFHTDSLLSKWPTSSQQVKHKNVGTAWEIFQLQAVLRVLPLRSNCSQQEAFKQFS